VTAPALASTASQGHRVYTWAGREFPSVTAILKGGVPAPFLVQWAAKAAAEYAIANLDRLRLLPARSGGPRGQRCPLGRPRRRCRPRHRRPRADRGRGHRPPAARAARPG
jgi:hypothetical protein